MVPEPAVADKFAWSLWVALMTDNENPPPLDCLGSDNVLRLLEPLRRSAAGQVIYRQVAHVVRETERTQNLVCRGYAAVLHTLLNALRRQLPRDSLLYLELKLVQQRLQPPITLAELAVLRDYIRNVATLMQQVTEPDAALLREALAPLLDGHAGSEPLVSPGPLPAAASRGAAPEPSPEGEGELTASAELRLSSLYRQRLDKQRQEFEELQANLAHKVAETIQQQEKFGLMLEVALENLKQADDARGLDAARHHAIQEIEQMLAGQNQLVRMLNDTRAFLQLVRNNSERLSSELDQVRVLSLTDELTGLPNRRAFLRRLEDEIGRAQRYESPLTIAILDLDNFKQINDTHGHAIGDEMLKTYARDVLSIFRHHDMVARYGGEEFAVLLPNTTCDGTLRALDKVRRRAEETRLIHGMAALPAPTFSAGVAVYEPGENIDSLINRADGLLYLAKQEGRNCVKVDPGNCQDQAVERPGQT